MHIKVKYTSCVVVINSTLLTDVRWVRYPFSAVGLEVAPSIFGQQLPQTHQIHDRELSVDFGAVEYVSTLYLTYHVVRGTEMDYDGTLTYVLRFRCQFTCICCVSIIVAKFSFVPCYKCIPLLLFATTWSVVKSVKVSCDRGS